MWDFMLGLVIGIVVVTVTGAIVFIKWATDIGKRW